MGFVILSGRKLKTAAIVLLCAVACAVFLGVSGKASVFYGYAARKLPIYYVKTEQKQVALTFDCAWGVDYTDKLLDIMREEDIKATFFAVEFWTEKYGDYAKKIVGDGHEIGTHSATHPYMSKLKKEEIERELKTSSEAIERATGVYPKIFRPPYGDYNDLLIDTAKGFGLDVIQWDVDSLDWKDLSAAEIENRVLSKVKNGSIVLFHNQGLHTAEALKSIIEKLKSKGFAFKRVSDLIYHGDYIIDADGGQNAAN